MYGKHIQNHIVLTKLILSFLHAMRPVIGAMVMYSLRKEVIQPHLPIRLPCYDFTPVIGLTFDCCLLR